MNKRLVLLAGGILLSTILAVVGILLLNKHQNTPVSDVPIGQPVALGTTQTPASTSDVSSGSTDYSSYDQYKTKTAALFQDETVGSGTEVKTGSKVAINYRAYLTNGQEFDETYSRNQPFLFTVGEHKIIIGLEEDVVGMKVGGKRRFIIPPAAGYGDKGYGPIPGGAVLVFDVELVAAQ